MSTEHQQYSIANQSQIIRNYAQAHSMSVVRTYSDEGKSGLTLHRRDGLRRLLEDVETKNTDFSAILVYDDGAGFRMWMKAPTMSTAAARQRLTCIIVQNCFRMTAASPLGF